VTASLPGPVPVRAVLDRDAGTAGTRSGRWVLLGSAGLWCADCLVPGCGWTTTTARSDTATTAAVLHDLTHPHSSTTSTASTRAQTIGRTA
jgi:hypothetical protein